MVGYIQSHLKHDRLYIGLCQKAFVLNLSIHIRSGRIIVMARAWILSVLYKDILIMKKWILAKILLYKDMEGEIHTFGSVGMMLTKPWFHFIPTFGSAIF